jgi:hypothetical protein
MGDEIDLNNQSVASSIEGVLRVDDAERVVFGLLEKRIAYVVVICSSAPILLIPLIYRLLGKNIYKVTAVILGFILLLVAAIYFRFSWIIAFTSVLKNYA